MENAKIPGLPETGYYFPNFISIDEEDRMIAEIRKLPETKWTKLSHRRLMSLPSGLTGKAKDTLIAAPLPRFLEQHILPRMRTLGIFDKSPHGAPNHVLVNEYKPGEGITPHEDGPAYYPVTATVSLGGHTVLDVYQKNENGERKTRPTWRILQEPRSLLITTGEMYKDTLHGISEVEMDEALSSDEIANWALLGDSRPYESGNAERSVRISLTYRDVLKVSKLGGALKFMTKG